MCLAPFYPALDKRPKSQPVQNAITTFFSTSCVQHLQHRVPIPSSGVWGHLLEIWGLSEVRLQFPKCHEILPICSWVPGTRNCVWKDIHHIIVLSSMSTYIKQTVEDLNLRLEQIHSQPGHGKAEDIFASPVYSLVIYHIPVCVHTLWLASLDSFNKGLLF